MPRKFRALDGEYWSNVCIAFAQITFGVLWATVFLPFDVYKIFVIILNIVVTIIFVFAGLLLKRRLNSL